MKATTVLLVTVALLVAGVTSVAAATDYVVMDTREAAFTVYAGVAEDKVEGVKARAAETKGIAIVSYDEFARSSDGYVKKHIVKDDYPGSGAAAALVEIVRKRPGVPIALTWNGGAALTFNDYRHARRTLEAYRADPVAYERTKGKDPRMDPVNPSNHLPFLMGR